MSVHESIKYDHLLSDSDEEMGGDECGIYVPGYHNSTLEWERECRNMMLNSGKFETDKVPQYPGFANIESRRRSYEHWPAGTGVTPEELSIAGLFSCCQGDRTFCFQCGGALEKWCPGDIPLLEHAKWYPKCDFIAKLRGNMPINDLITTLRNGSVIDESYINELMKLHSAENKMNDAIAKMQAVVSSIDITMVKDEQKKSALDALKILLTEMGSVNNDSKKGQNEVTVNNSAELLGDGLPSPSRNDTKTSISCIICLNEPRDALLLPCSHIATCTKCASKLKNCCVCRIPITFHKRVYIS